MNKYDVVESDSLVELIKTVQEKVDNGWKPQGGISATYIEWENERKGYTESYWMYFQAIFKEND